MQGTQDSKPCRKCLLSEMNETAFFETVQQYIDSIPPHEKTPKDEYLRRLVLCKNCEYLTNGMCVLCGCYVEVRAAKAWQHCVNGKGVW